MEAEKHLHGEAETEALGQALARCLPSGSVVFLKGDLGAGKTTLVRGFLHALGHRGAVKSPTYTLVEPYAVAGKHVFHFDLYRLGGGEELEFMGIRDYFTPHSICLIEWPERGAGYLPHADLQVQLIYDGIGARRAHVAAFSDVGRRCLNQLKDEIGLFSAS